MEIQPTGARAVEPKRLERDDVERIAARAFKDDPPKHMLVLSDPMLVQAARGACPKTYITASAPAASSARDVGAELRGVGADVVCVGDFLDQRTFTSARRVVVLQRGTGSHSSMMARRTDVIVGYVNPQRQYIFLGKGRDLERLVKISATMSGAGVLVVRYCENEQLVQELAARVASEVIVDIAADRAGWEAELAALAIAHAPASAPRVDATFLNLSGMPAWTPYVTHALDLLAGRGKMVAIVPTSPSSTPSRPLRTALRKYGDVVTRELGTELYLLTVH